MFPSTDMWCDPVAFNDADLLLALAQADPANAIAALANPHLQGKKLHQVANIATYTIARLDDLGSGAWLFADRTPTDQAAIVIAAAGKSPATMRRMLKFCSMRTLTTLRGRLAGPPFRGATALREGLDEHTARANELEWHLSSPDLIGYLDYEAAAAQDADGHNFYAPEATVELRALASMSDPDTLIALAPALDVFLSDLDNFSGPDTKAEIVLAATHRHPEVVAAWAKLSAGGRYLAALDHRQPAEVTDPLWDDPALLPALITNTGIDYDRRVAALATLFASGMALHEEGATVIAEIDSLREIEQAQALRTATDLATHVCGTTRLLGLLDQASEPQTRKATILAITGGRREGISLLSIVEALDAAGDLGLAFQYQVLNELLDTMSWYGFCRLKVLYLVGSVMLPGGNPSSRAEVPFFDTFLGWHYAGVDTATSAHAAEAHAVPGTKALALGGNRPGRFGLFHPAAEMVANLGTIEAIATLAERLNSSAMSVARLEEEFADLVADVASATDPVSVRNEAAEFMADLGLSAF